MRKFYLCIFFLFSSLGAAEHLQYVDEVRAIFANEMLEKHGLYCTGTFGSMPNDVKEIGLKFVVFQRATIEEARALQIIATNRFLEIINAHEKIRPFLREYPFTPGRVVLTVSYVNPENKGTYCDGSVTLSMHIGCATEDDNPNRNTLIYDRYDAFAEKFKDIYREPYEEAEALVTVTHLPEHVTTPQEEALDAFFKEAKRRLQVEHRVTIKHIGTDNATKIGEIHATCTSLKKADEEEGRRIGIAVVESLIQYAQNDENLKPYLKPLTANSMRVQLNFRNRRNRPHFKGLLDHMLLNGGEITYLSTPYEENLLANPKVTACESFQEALARSQTAQS